MRAVLFGLIVSIIYPVKAHAEAARADMSLAAYIPCFLVNTSGTRSASLEIWYNNLKPPLMAARVHGTRLMLTHRTSRTFSHAKPQQVRFCWVVSRRHGIITSVAAYAAECVRCTRSCAGAQGFENIEPCKTAAGAVLFRAALRRHGIIESQTTRKSDVRCLPLSPDNKLITIGWMIWIYQIIISKAKFVRI